MTLSVTFILGWVPGVFAQQGGGAYGAGQVVGGILLVLLVGAILWKVLKR